MLFWDDSANVYFDGSEYETLTPRVSVYVGDVCIARNVERHEVRMCLIRHFRKAGKRFVKFCERLAYAVENGNIDLQITYEYRLGVTVC